MWRFVALYKPVTYRSTGTWKDRRISCPLVPRRDFLCKRILERSRSERSCSTDACRLIVRKEHKRCTPCCPYRGKSHLQNCIRFVRSPVLKSYLVCTCTPLLRNCSPLGTCCRKRNIRTARTIWTRRIWKCMKS